MEKRKASKHCLAGPTLPDGAHFPLDDQEGSAASRSSLTALTSAAESALVVRIVLPHYYSPADCAGRGRKSEVGQLQTGRRVCRLALALLLRCHALLHAVRGDSPRNTYRNPSLTATATATTTAVPGAAHCCYCLPIAITRAPSRSPAACSLSTCTRSTTSRLRSTPRHIGAAQIGHSHRHVPSLSSSSWSSASWPSSSS